jgi:ABC-type antimicrobial peptide transport system permease subunit
MYANFFITAWRNLVKNKIHTTLNITGLSIGIVVCLFICVWLQRELSFDNFHPDGDQIFRITNTFKSQSEGFSQAPSGVALAAQLPKQLPIIKSACRVFQFEHKFRVGNNSFFEHHTFVADSNFFSFFGFQLQQGQASLVLNSPDLLVLTEKTAFKYFGTTKGIIAGRDFSPQMKTDSFGSVLINRTAASYLGLTPEQTIGKWIKNITRDSLRMRIIGVVEDYHYASLKEPIGPLVISTSDDRRLALLRLKTSQIQSTIQIIKTKYAAAAPDYPFEYSFLNEEFNQLYKSEITQESILSIFSLIAIFITCLGLFGLASFTTAKRTKEIGVRKVLGSSIQNIVTLLSKDLIKPVLLGTLIVMPIGYLVMHSWLQGFAYRVDIHWWEFALAAIMATIIAILTVSLQALKSALANPVKSLRTE